ncbi:MAG: segregation/condensation protein A [Deltaproteobacteria bacterium]|nr:segregation/condensation protein A [Deltaproteobacteria bacterium]MBW2265403.1 segregation/condensation protein A [Deltaproteobacteria bacterium]MBW2318132.1 segregation/condensation protein A [Deltaproteobacteria bacterium]MBW2602288.1 segregation/condensation protein A [Deltaproteobacteria bacterium]OEU44909.1 MAG: chromosome segregation protein ScpA [Desulfobacterales bacterium S7086C20]
MKEQLKNKSESPYEVQLGETFEGPMDLLLHLVKKNEVDIYDIPVAMIMEQYMEYLKLMRIMNIDVAGNFLVMAATLAQIKSRMLLPVDEEQEEDEEDPRMELVRPLEEYLQIKYAAEDLAVRNRLDWDVFTRNVSEDTEACEKQDQEFVNISLFELIDAFQKIVKRVSSKHFMDITVDTISVNARISEVADLLEQHDSVSFQELLEGQDTKGQLIVTFLAILEMAKSQIIRIMQHVESGIIRIFNG